MAVNVLPLDRYLRGVVPWEVPVGWHTQTYEAQAVAARSYTLAMLKPGEDFDLYPDDRSQMYGGIKAERTETNLAIGATAGQVLEFAAAIIPAYYFSSSGGRTSSIHDEWPQMQQVPYLVSVADPYDYLSPHHVWPTTVLTPAAVAAELHVSGVLDLRVVRNSSGRAEAVRALTASGWKQFPGQVIRTRFKLGSTDFDIHAMTLDDLPGRLVYGNHARVQGWVRGLGKARLQELTAAGWQTVRHIQPAPSGHFEVSIPAVRSTELRLAYNGVAGDAVTMQVVPRVSLSARDGDLHALVSPSLPCRSSGSRTAAGVSSQARAGSSIAPSDPVATASRCGAGRRTSQPSRARSRSVRSRRAASSPAPSGHGRGRHGRGLTRSRVPRSGPKLITVRAAPQRAGSFRAFRAFGLSPADTTGV